MYCDPSVLAARPCSLSADALCKALHIRKQTALGLLRSGMLPVSFGRVEKEDLQSFWRRLEERPDLQGRLSKKLRKTSRYQVRLLPPPLPESRLRSYYQSALQSWPEVLDVAAICRVTGYRRTAVRNWLLRGELPCLMREPKYQVPKPWLITYLCSDTYNQKNRKSDAHVRMLWEAYRGGAEAWE